MSFKMGMSATFALMYKHHLPLVPGCGMITAVAHQGLEALVVSASDLFRSKPVERRCNSYA